MTNISPKAEPVAWSVVIAAVIAAAASYGLNITTEMKDLLILIGPFIVAGIVARFRVYAPDTTERLTREAYEAGTPPTEPKPDVPPPAQA